VIVERHVDEGRRKAGAGLYFFQGQGKEQPQCGSLTYALLGPGVS